MTHLTDVRSIAVVVTWLATASCQPNTRTYFVEVSKEQVCRTFDPLPEACAFTNSPGLTMTITIEERAGGKAIIYGRSDSGEERVYLADVPRAGRYESTEESNAEDKQTGCRSNTRVVLALNVDDKGLEGGEEFRVDEGSRCNDLGQHRITRRLREWLGSREDE